MREIVVVIGPTAGEAPESEAVGVVTAGEAAVGVTLYKDGDPYIVEVLDSSGIYATNLDLDVTTSWCTYTATSMRCRVVNDARIGSVVRAACVGGLGT